MTFQQECAERSIKLGFTSAIAWRDRIAKKYPDDDRIPEAIDIMRRLNAQFKLSDHDWTLLAPHFNGADANWTRAVRESQRQIGFLVRPTNTDEYVAGLLYNLTEGRVN